MGIYVVPQPVDRPPYISGPTNRNIIFVQYSHTVTALEAGYFELWSPYVNGSPEPHHAEIHMATVALSDNLNNPKTAQAFMQSPDETIRTLISSPSGIGPKSGIYSLGYPFISVYGSRGVLVLNAAPQGLIIITSYQLELI